MDAGGEIGSSADLPAAVTQLLAADGQVAGAGFLVAEDTLVSCAHVVENAGSGPGAAVRMAFPHVPGAGVVTGLVLEELWRAPSAEDIAVVRLAGPVPGTRTVALGSAAGCQGHEVVSYGFPFQAFRGGHFGSGIAGNLLPVSEDVGTVLQLTGANDLTTGFSGGPVLDERTGLVIGMLTGITAPDPFDRGQGIAYVTPAETLRRVMPELAERAVCPYRGLEPFTAEHTRWFQGRGDAVRQVLANLAAQRRLTLLLGPSGSGKSSLVQAGVLPALAEGAVPGSDRWLPVLARPRHDLPAEIESAGLPGAASEGIAAAANRRLAAEGEHHRVLLVIDQLEELLVQSGNGRLRAVIDEITTLADAYTKLTVILIMRDDFYPHLAALAPQLLEAAMPGLLNVPGTLSRQDLHDIITLPARDVGLRFQPGLPEQIIGDVLAISPEATVTSQAPVTVLPLLEMALSQLWLRRENGFLTHEAYQRIGAVSGSLTTWCDEALAELSPEQQSIARRALTSLVRPTDPSHHVSAVRTQVPLDELRALAADPGRAPDAEQRAVNDVLSVLTRHRIITTQTLPTAQAPGAPPGEAVAELTHEALIRDWGALRRWVDQDRRFQEWLERARERRAAWAEQRNPGDLLGGTALAEGLDWQRRRHLPAEISEYLAASRQHQQAVIRRSRRLNAILAGVLAVALLAGVVAVFQWRKAVGERQAALSQQLAAEAYTLMRANPELASLLAVEAYKTSPTPVSQAVLETAADLPHYRRLAGHTQPVTSVAFSRNGRILATGSYDHTVRLWDITTGRHLRTLTGHTAKVEAVAFSPDGHTLATGSDDNTARIWDTTTGKRIRTLTGHKDWVTSVAFSPDGRTVATGSLDSTARLWDPATGRTLRTFVGHSNSVEAVAFNPKGPTLATGSDDNTARIWDLTTGKHIRTLTGHTDVVESVAFSPNGRTLATGSYDDTAVLWDVASGKIRTTLSGHTDIVWSVAFSPNGRTLATASADHTARLWDVTTGAVRATLLGHTSTVYTAAFSPDGSTLATGSTDHSVRLWNVTTGAIHTSLAGHTDVVTAAAFSPDGRTLATGSWDRTARLWDVKAGRSRRSLTGHTARVESVAFSPDGRTVATGSDDSTVRLWDAHTGKHIRTLTGHMDAVESVAFSPDSRTIATGSDDNTVRLWDAHTGKHIRTLTGHIDAVESVAFSPDGRTLASGSDDETVRLWHAKTGKHIRTLTGHTEVVNAVTFSHDGRTLASGSSDFTVRLWDTSDYRLRTTVRTSRVQAVAFSPDSRTLATGSQDSTARLWDATAGTLRFTMIGHNDWVNGVAFSPDGRLVATASGDHTAQLWNPVLPKPATAIRDVCQAVKRDLTREERTAYLQGHSVGHVCPTHP
ncbi:trypsin-like peptidase domain-containing protein [Streptomyces sp. NPDC127190]|uniref:nSTAND1 domain-containing NTPase n=1 Tax=unclassified Streptomyces TaxID=2593676 RepID=UPI0036428081